MHGAFSTLLLQLLAAVLWALSVISVTQVLRQSYREKQLYLLGDVRLKTNPRLEVNHLVGYFHNIILQTKNILRLASK